MLLETDCASLAAAIRAEIPSMDEALCIDYAGRLIAETDGRLEVNVHQWLCGEPLTDVWIGKYCIGMVMQIRGGRDFLGALEALNHYARDPAVGERIIWRTKQ